MSPDCQSAPPAPHAPQAHATSAVILPLCSTVLHRARQCQPGNRLVPIECLSSHLPSRSCWRCADIDFYYSKNLPVTEIERLRDQNRGCRQRPMSYCCHDETHPLLRSINIEPVRFKAALRPPCLACPDDIGASVDWIPAQPLETELSTLMKRIFTNCQ